MAVQIERRNTLRVEDLELIGAPEKFVELIDGELIEMTPAGHRHNRIASRFEALFETYCASRPEMEYGGDNDGFLVQRNPDTLLSPDASLFRERPGSGTTWLEFAPEIVVEVKSPSNNITEMTLKRHRYFEGGTEQFWIADPEAQSLEIHHKDGRVVRAEGAVRIEGEGIAAGMVIDLAHIFRER